MRKGYSGDRFVRQHRCHFAPSGGAPVERGALIEKPLMAYTTFRREVQTVQTTI